MDSWLKTKYFWLIVITGVTIRLFLSFFTFHPDIRAFQLAGEIISAGNILTFYDYLETLPKSDELIHVFGVDLFIYPPAIYLYHAIYNFLFNNILGLSVINDYSVENFRSFYNWNFNLHILLLKLPYLIFDLLIGIYLIKLFDRKEQKMWALILWVFNPVNLYVTYMMGQFDLIPVFFTVLALYYFKQNKKLWSALWLGFGIAFKIYPLFFVIPLMITEKRWSRRILILVISLIPYLLFALPYLGSEGFKNYALIAGQTNKSMFATLLVSAGVGLMYFVVGMVFLYAYLYSKNITKLWYYLMLVLFIFYIFTDFHPQWFLWIVPFFIIDLIVNRFRNLIYMLIILGLYVTKIFLFDSSLTVRIFAPLNPPLYEMPDIWKILGINLNYNYSKSLVHSAMVGVILYYFYYFLGQKYDEKD